MSSLPVPLPSYVKLIRKDRTHTGLVLVEGLNCLKPDETFDPNPACGPGGLYFCKEEDVCHWIDLYNEVLGFVATVTLCSDSTVITMGAEHKLKTDRFVLGPFQPLEEYLTAERCLQIVKQRGVALQWVPCALRTPELCLAAIQQDCCALVWVPEALRTPEFCLAAIQHNGYALQCVPETLRIPELYLAAVQQNGDSHCYEGPESMCACRIGHRLALIEYRMDALCTRR